MRRPGTWVAYPDDRAAAISGSPAHDGLGLDIAAWCESSRYRLDGRFTVDRIRRFRGWSTKRQARLIEAGFWKLDGVEIVLVGYLAFNPSKERIAEVSEVNRRSGKTGATGRDRDALGRLAPDVDADFDTDFDTD